MEPVHDVRGSTAAGGAVLKQLTILRHAKSSWDEPGLDDHERPLSNRGLRDAPRMGQRLVDWGLQPQLILSSTAVRALTTAELVLPAFTQPPVLITEPRLYHASPGDILAVVAAQAATIDSLMIVGHNPGMTYLCNMLIPDFSLQNLPTAGAFSVHCETDDWSSIDAAGFQLAFCDYPKNPAAPGKLRHEK